MADVDGFFFRVRIRPLQNQLSSTDQLTIFARKANGPTALRIYQRDDLLIDQSSQHHFYDINGFAVGYPQAFHKLAFLTHPFQQTADLWTAAVHNHGIHADQLHQRDVPGKPMLQLLVHHGIATILNDNRLAVKTAYVG